MSEHYVYVLECSDDTFYTGYTVSLTDRFEAHVAGRAAKYTRGRPPLRTVHAERFASRSEAMRREHEIKTLTRGQKERLIEGRRDAVGDRVADAALPRRD